jgi:hypothetical protein
VIHRHKEVSDGIDLHSIGAALRLDNILSADDRFFVVGNTVNAAILDLCVECASKPILLNKLVIRCPKASGVKSIRLASSLMPEIMSCSSMNRGSFTSNSTTAGRIGVPAAFVQRYRDDTHIAHEHGEHIPSGESSQITAER